MLPTHLTALQLDLTKPSRLQRQRQRVHAPAARALLARAALRHAPAEALCRAHGAGGGRRRRVGGGRPGAHGVLRLRSDARVLRQRRHAGERADRRDPCARATGGACRARAAAGGRGARAHFARRREVHRHRAALRRRLRPGGGVARAAPRERARRRRHRRGDAQGHRVAAGDGQAQLHPAGRRSAGRQADPRTREERRCRRAARGSGRGAGDRARGPGHQGRRRRRRTRSARAAAAARSRCNPREPASARAWWHGCCACTCDGEIVTQHARPGRKGRGARARGADAARRTWRGCWTTRSRCRAGERHHDPRRAGARRDRASARG